MIFNSRKVSFKSNVVPRLYAILDTAIDLVLAYKITSSLQHITVISCKREVSWCDRSLPGKRFENSNSVCQFT